MDILGKMYNKSGECTRTLLGLSSHDVEFQYCDATAGASDPPYEPLHFPCLPHTVGGQAPLALFPI